MPMKSLTIQAVEAGSPAAEAGVTAGATLVSVNGQPIQDALELRFAETASRVVLVWRDDGGTERRSIIRKPDDLALGLEVDPLKMHACNNKCAFCFAHQNARGMRRALYFKDDDYRFSFLNGNFATLTNLTEADTARIIAQRLSPLYVSVHATDWALRRQLLGNPNAPDVLGQIARFAAARIAMHTQVVLCPGLNDGAQLAKTLEDLASLPSLRRNRCVGTRRAHAVPREASGAPIARPRLRPGAPAVGRTVAAAVPAGPGDTIRLSVR